MALDDHDHAETPPLYSPQAESHGITAVRAAAENAPEKPIANESDCGPPPAFTANGYILQGDAEPPIPNPDDLAQSFLNEIQNERLDVVAALISQGVITADSTFDGRTPLLTAVATKNIALVRLLLESGAEIDAFGVYSRSWDRDGETVTLRTPLQLAAAVGSLPIVKLLYGEHHSNDSLIAPDGQIALRLAAAAGHREIVAYLPARRAGGFRRWQTQHRKALRRVRRALSGIAGFGKFFLWDVEKFFLWTVPKHVIVGPLTKAARYCWDRRREFGPWCKAQLLQVGPRLKRFAVAVPRVVHEFLTVDLPHVAIETLRYTYSLSVHRIPAALLGVIRWVGAALALCGHTLLTAAQQVASVLHTAGSAIATFLRTTTFKDVWNGICTVLHTIFVDFPRGVVSWIARFGQVSYDVLKVMLGSVGKCIWWVLAGIVYLGAYVPRKLWDVLCGMGSSLANMWHEVVVLMNPKR